MNYGLVYPNKNQEWLDSASKAMSKIDDFFGSFGHKSYDIIIDFFTKNKMMQCFYLYKMIIKHAQNQGGIFKISQAGLAQLINTSVSTLKRYQTTLLSWGLVMIQRTRSQTGDFYYNAYTPVITTEVIQSENERHFTNYEIETCKNYSWDEYIYDEPLPPPETTNEIEDLALKHSQEIEEITPSCTKSNPQLTNELSLNPISSNNNNTHSLKHLFNDIYCTGVQIMNSVGNKVKNVFNFTQEKKRISAQDFDDIYPPSPYYKPTPQNKDPQQPSQVQVLANKLLNSYQKMTKTQNRPKESNQESNPRPILSDLERDIDKLRGELGAVQKYWQELQLSNPAESLKVAPKFMRLKEKLDKLISQRDIYINPPPIEQELPNHNREITLQHCMHLVGYLNNSYLTDNDIIESGKQVLYAFSNRSLGKKMAPDTPDENILAIGAHLVKNRKWLKPFGYPN